MRGERMFNILSVLDDGKDVAMNLLGSYLFSGISYNPKKSSALTKTFLDERNKVIGEKKLKREQVRRFYSFVRYLEQDGLVRREESTGEATISITSKGKKKLEFLKTSYSLWLPSSKYAKDSDSDRGLITIVTFDIPEKQRAKRDWLRCALDNLDFDMIHRSVWMGKCGVPEKFLEDIKEMEMSDYVEIFAITKMGSLKKMT